MDMKYIMAGDYAHINSSAREDQLLMDIPAW